MSEPNDRRDSDEVSASVTSVGGLTFDEAVDLVRESNPGGPVRTVIKSTADDGYQVETQQLEVVERDGSETFMRTDRFERMNRIEAEVGSMDILVESGPTDPSVVANYDQGRLSFTVEADAVNSPGGLGAMHEYHVPKRVVDLVSGYDGLSIVSAILNPYGRGTGTPSYSITLELER